MVLKLYQVIGRQFILDDSFAPIATFSWTYSGNGQGDSVDMVDKWAQIIRIDGLVINDWRMRPWTQKPIVIRSFTLSKISGGSHRNMMVGNNYVADAMVNVGSSETSMWSGVPQATGIPFPGTEDDPGDAYFDLHGFCAAGGTSWRVDIAYSPQPLGIVEPPPPPPPPPPSTFQSCNEATGQAVTLSPADKDASITLANGNLTAQGNGSGAHRAVRATHPIGLDKKAYFEVTWSGLGGQVGGPPVMMWGVGDGTSTLQTYVGNMAKGVAWGYNAGAGILYTNGTSSSSAIGAPLPNSGTLGCAVDGATGKVWFRNAAGWLSGHPGTGASPSATLAAPQPMFPAVSFYGGGSVTFNFGASPFAYPLP
jgi:hypothetical protein